VNYNTRFPSLPEFYWFGAGYQPPGRTRNTALLPEFGMQYEAGVTQKLPFNSIIRVRTYYYDINNYIRTIFGYRPSRVVYNIDLARFMGVEVEGEVALPHNFFAFANYTYQRTNTSPDPLNGNVQRLTELPLNKANIGLKYKHPDGAEARIYVRMVSRRDQPQLTINAQNRITKTVLRPMGGFYTLNVEGRYPVVHVGKMKGYLYAGVENLTSQFYEEDAGYPMPTATFYGGVQIRY
jgi:iron complex outermembrane receptor protein